MVATHEVFFAEAGRRRRGRREDDDLSSGHDELRARHPRLCSSNDVIGAKVGYIRTTKHSNDSERKFSSSVVEEHGDDRRGEAGEDQSLLPTVVSEPGGTVDGRAGGRMRGRNSNDTGERRGRQYRSDGPESR